MSTALNRLALRIHAVEHELKSSRIPQLAHSSVSLEDGTEMGVIEGFETAVAAEDIANGAVTAAVEAQEAADAAAAKALAVEAAAAQAKADAAAAATAATAAQSAADQAKADAAAVATEVDGIPAQIATAKSEAITTSAGTAQQKADAAQQAAIDAAALTAQAKADAAKAAALTEAAVTAQQKADAAAATAKAEAVAAAATDAQNKADLAKAAAINAAATDATNKANTAQTNAINSAATTAQQKADAAKQAAIDAAAADAASKASAAQSAATAAAATDAQTKADAAKAAAEAAAKTYSDTVSSGAKADAIAAAAADAKTKADAAEAAAKTAAAADAKAKADAAQAAAIAAAASDAQTKADVAKAAAINAAATDATSKADAAKAAAISAAATDAASKAAQAKTDAINAAALTAQDKADLAQAQAIATAMGMDASNANPSFTDWASAYPAGWGVWNGGAPIKETALARTINAVRYNVAAAGDQAGILSSTALTPLPLKLDYVTLTLDVQLISGSTFQGAGILFDWVASGTYRVTTSLATEVPSPIVGKWYRITKVMKRPTFTATQTAYSCFIMANYTSLPGGGAVKNIAFDRFAVRPSTAEEVAAYNAAPASAVTDLTSTIASRGTDLVTNGTGLLGTNQNFPSFSFNGADAPTGAAGSFVINTTGSTSALIDDLIPFDPAKSYRLSCQLRQTVAGVKSTAYGFLAPYDASNLSIQPYHYMWVTGTTTTLAAPLNPGDMTIKLTSAANWWGQTGKAAGASNHYRSLIWWDYVDAFGKAWPVETYSRNWSGSDYWADGGVDLATNTITLKAAYAGPARPAGTKLSNGSSGGSYIYMPSLSANQVPETWSTYADTFASGVMSTAGGPTGVAASWGQGMPSGTAKVKVGWLLNYTVAGGKHAVAAVSFSDASAANATAKAVEVLTNGWKATGKTTIDGGKIETDSITAAQIATDAITANELKAGAVIAGKVAANAILAANIKAGEIAADHLAANAVIAGKIAANAVVAGSIAAGQISARHLVLADTSNMAEINETYAGSVAYSGWSHILETDANGVVWSKRDNIAANGYFMFRNQVGPLPFKAGDRIRLTFEAFADATVTYPNPYYWTYGGPSVYGPLTAVGGSPTQITTTPQSFQYEVVVGSITSQTQYLIGLAGATGRDIRVRNVRAYVMNAAELIVDGTVTANKVAANAVTAEKIEAGAVIAGKLAADAIAANNIQAGAVIAGKLAADAVLANNILAGAVVAGKLAADAVLATNVAADAILARNIKAGQITADKLVAGTITAASGVIGSIDAAKITVGKLTAAQMATGTITAASGSSVTSDAAKITVGKITAAQMQAGTITAASGIIGSIDAAKITVGQITASQLAADAIDGKVITGATVRTAASGQRWVLGTGAGASTLYAYTGRTDEQFPAYITAFADAGGLALSAAGISATPPPSGESTPAARLDIGVDPNDPTRRLVRQVWAHGNEVLADENILLQGAGTGTGRDGGHISVGRPRNNSLSYARGVHISGNITLDPNFGGAPGYGGDNKVTAKGDLAVEGNLTLGGKPAPQGWLGGDRRITNSGSTSGSTEVSICQTFINVKAGHKYRITGWSNLQSSVAGDGAGLRYKVNGSVVALAQVYLPIAGTAWPSTDTVIWTADITGQVPFETAFYRARGTGTLLCYANTSQASYIDVEHIGSA